MTFEEDIRKWAALDTKIADINSTVKGLRNEKNEVEQSILRHVEDNSLNSATVKLSDSKLQFVDSKTTPPLTFKFLKMCLLDIVEDQAEVDEIICYIRNKREPKTSLSIKRFFTN
jgi:hypothetical protein